MGSTTVCGICLLLVPSTHSVVLLAALLATMGGMAASVFVPMIDLVGRVVSPANRGFAMSLVSSGTSYGVVIDSVLVPLFPGGRWRTVWDIVGLATLVTVALAFVVFRRADLFRLGGSGAAGGPAGGQADGGIRAAMPWVLVIWALSFLNGLSTYPFQNYLSPYLREELGFTVSYAASVWGTIGVVGTVAGLSVGWLSSRLGLQSAILFCYLCFLLAGAILAFAPTAQLSLLSGVLFSLGFYPIFGLLPAYASHRTSAATAVSIFGLGNVAQGLGGMTGNFGAGIIKTTTHSFSGIYLTFAGLALLCILLAMILPRSRSR